MNARLYAPGEIISPRPVQFGRQSGTVEVLPDGTGKQARSGPSA